MFSTSVWNIPLGELQISYRLRKLHQKIVLKKSNRRLHAGKLVDVVSKFDFEPTLCSKIRS